MRLALYLSRRFLVSVAMMIAVFCGILFLVDMVEQLRIHAGNPDMGLVAAIRLAGLNLPRAIYEILPLVVMLGSVSMFLGLSRSSELVAIRAAGRSALRALTAPVIAAMVLGAVAVAVLNPIVSATQRAAERASSSLSRGPEQVLSVSRDGLWLRQGDATGQTVIRAARVGLDGTRLYDATFLTFAAEGPPVMRIEAEEAVLMPGRWVLLGAKKWPLDAENPEREAIALQEADLATDLTIDRIRDSFGAREAIAIWDLPEFIAALERAGFSATRHRLWLQSELALPVTLATMVLLAAGFTLRHARAGRTGTMVLLAIMAGFGMFFLRNFAQVLGENGQIPIALAAWAPPAAAAMAALGLLLHLEDG